MALRDFAKKHWIVRAGADEPAELFVVPPTPDRIARRMAVLAAVITRCMIEQAPDLDDPSALLRDELAFYLASDLAQEAEPDEDALIRAPWGTLAKQDVINGVWRNEGLGTLAWSLGLLTHLPPIDRSMSPGHVADVVDVPWGDGPGTMHIPSPARRPDADLEKLDTLLLTAHWRLVDFRVNPRAMDYAAWVPGVEWATLSLDGLEVADRDLAVGGLPIMRADPDHVSHTSSVLVERRLAVSWLMGYDELYSCGDTNT